jgi:hypothetical protein
MKQSVFNLNALKAHPERNAFDLSHNDVFSCAPGMLLPISCTEVLPNEHYEINPQIFLRTMPLNSAAFVRMRQHVEFFFVPMRVLCRQFNQFVVGTKYSISSSTNSVNWLQRVIGFQNRYLEYKTGIDKVHGQFCSGGTLSAWTAPRNSGIIEDTGGGMFSMYSLKVSPKILNSICSVAFNGRDNTDPILVDSHIGIKAIRPMSVSDEPLL